MNVNCKVKAYKVKLITWNVMYIEWNKIMRTQKKLGPFQDHKKHKREITYLVYEKKVGTFII